jgi:ABC-type multidrug transport system ATPase subunit
VLQVDPLLDLLTPVEQLMMYAHLKGVSAHLVRSVTDGLLSRCGLPLAMTDVQSGTLSGGNKRKVSLAISLAGEPAVVLLDEPSSGMDNEGRSPLKQTIEGPRARNVCHELSLAWREW